MGLTRPEVVVLDLDGTLMDHPAAARSAALRWLRAQGVTGSDDELAEAWLAAEDRHFVRFERGEITHDEQRRERLREVIPGLGLPLPDDVAALDALFAGFLAEYERSWVGYADAVPCVAALRAAGLRVAVLTNGITVQQEGKVRAVGVADLLTDGLFATDRLPAAKPDRAAYDHVAAALGVEPSDLVMVGDNPVNDVAAALAAGWRAVWLDRDGVGLRNVGDSALPREQCPHPPSADVRHAPRIVSLTELPALLGA